MRTATLDELSEVFVRLVSIPSPSGEERDMADAVLGFVRDCGLSIVEDEAAERTGCASGNLLARVPGRGQGTPIALCAHLDTVPVERAPTVICEDGIAHSDGETVLGADDKAAVAVLLALLRDLAFEPPAADVEVLFTVGEEIGLRGARAFDLAGLRGEVMFVLDSEGAPGTMIIGAPTLKSVDAEFRGVAAHAGIDPERGRNAIAAAAHAVAAMRLGRLDRQTTANVGIVAGGSAVNVVAERCLVRAEVRSHDDARLAVEVGQMLETIGVAAAEADVDVEIDVREHFHAYRHTADALPLRMAGDAMAEAGLAAEQIDSGGGSDANIFNAGGLPAVTLGVGFERVHSPQERIRLDRLMQLYLLAHALVSVAGATTA